MANQVFQIDCGPERRAGDPASIEIFERLGDVVSFEISDGKIVKNYWVFLLHSESLFEPSDAFVDSSDFVKEKS